MTALLSGAIGVFACATGASDPDDCTAGATCQAAGAAGTSAGKGGGAGTVGTSGSAGSVTAGGSAGSGAGTTSTGGGGLGGSSAGNGGMSGGGSTGDGGTTGASGMSGSAGGGGLAGNAGTFGGGGMGGMSSGGMGGMGNVGNQPPTACEIGGAHNGDGSFTWYYFGQGTAKDGSGYRTACGYYGTEPNGQDSTRVVNIADPAMFVAIPGPTPENFPTAEYCGACVELQGQNGQKQIATVIDECPQNYNQLCAQNPNGALDLSRPAFNKLGFSVGDPRNTTWKFVPCPVEGNVKVRFKTGNNNEFFVENVVTAVKTIKVNGVDAVRTSYGAWHIDGAIRAPATLEMVDRAGRALTVTLNQGTDDQDTGIQFPRCL